MNVLLFMSVFWILYGIAGLLGFQNIPAKYKGHSWTKDYIHSQGLNWLILGLPWFGFYLVRTFLLAEADITTGMSVVILLLLSIPALIFSVIYEKKYKAMLAAEQSKGR